MITEIISLLAVIIAGISALYSKKAVDTASRSNVLHKIKILLDLKQSYLNEMIKQSESAKNWGTNDSFAQACREAYANAQIKYKEIIDELDCYHKKVIHNKPE